MAVKTVKALTSSQDVSKLLKKTYSSAHEEKERGKKVVWSSGIAPVELFHAMDLVPVFPENYAAACSTKQLGLELQQYTEAEGYSNDLCSYFRTDLGHIISGCTYLGGLPAPDLVVASRNLCTTHVQWLEIVAKRFGCPFFVLDQPMGPVEVKAGAWEPEPHRLSYGVEQLKELIIFLEEQTGKALDMDRLREAVALGDQAAACWIEINESRRHSPLPLSVTDMLGSLFLLVVLSGTSSAVEVLSKVAAEVKERAAQGIGAVANERYRLLWDSIPLWYNLALFQRFQEDGGVFAVELYNYGRVWGQRLDPQNPLESLTKRNLTHIFNVNGPQRVDYVAQIIRDFRIDGYVNHSIRSCNVLSHGTIYLADRLKDMLDIPVLTLHCDHCDPRALAPGTLENRVASFFELLENRKKAGHN